MYEGYWQLNAQPFGYQTSVDDLYESRGFQTASLRLRYCFANNAGAALLTGSAGVGKSTLLQQLNQQESDLQPFIHCALPNLSSDELLRYVARELTGRTYEATNEIVFHSIASELAKIAEKGHHAVIAFDEAHLLSSETLEKTVLPLLTLRDTQPGLQLSVILCGHPTLVPLLSRNAQLKDRIALTATLSGFTQEETRDYVQSRLSQAGATKAILTDSAISAVYELSQGLIRRINRLCDMALLVGYADQLDQIDVSDVEALASEFLAAAA